MPSEKEAAEYSPFTGTMTNSIKMHYEESRTVRYKDGDKFVEVDEEDFVAPHDGEYTLIIKGRWFTN